jgi:ribosomal subunit interface protein
MRQFSIRSEPEKPMNYNIEFKNYTPQKEIQKRIQELIGKIEKKAQAFSPDARYLRLMLEENSVRKLYRVSITLELPKKTLATNEERHELVAAIRDAFAEIERQLEAHKATLRGEPVWKRRTRREQLRKVK